MFLHFARDESARLSKCRQFNSGDPRTVAAIFFNKENEMSSHAKNASELLALAILNFILSAIGEWDSLSPLFTIAACSCLAASGGYFLLDRYEK